MTRESVRKAVREVLKRAPFTLRQLSEEAGVSYAALRGWAIGRRIADPESRARLVDALRRKSGELAKLANELERVTEGEGDE